MREAHEELARARLTVLVVGPDDADAFRRYFAAHDLPFVGIADPERRIAALYGQPTFWWSLGPLPATVLVEEGGRILLAAYGRHPADLPSPSRLVQALHGSAD